MGELRVGFREGMLFDDQRRNWSDDGPRPLQWSAWYPAGSDGAEATIFIPRTAAPFLMDTYAWQADLAQQQSCHRVVLLSHGTGGTASSLGWLAQRLAAKGYIVIGVDHHGNTASEPYHPAGFLCWWERARDLSITLDFLNADGPFARRLDLQHVSTVGFSLGGHTVLSLLGAVNDMALSGDRAGGTALGEGPREFPHLVDQLGNLFQNNREFKASWARQSASTLDPRVKSAIALAPAPPVRAFTLESLHAIMAPVSIIVGEADAEAPAATCSHWLGMHLSKCTIDVLDGSVGHYTLLCEGTALGKHAEPDIFTDPPGVHRRSVHDRVAKIVLAALAGA